MRVHHNLLGELSKAQAGLAPAAAKDAPKTSFAEALAKSSKAESKTSHAEARMKSSKAESKTSHADAFAESSKAESKTSHAEARARSSKTSEPDDALPKGPKGETTRAVEGHPAYVEIVSGPRNGMFINTTHNERRGEAFVLVRKHDRDLHIYGTGKNRRVIISWHKDQPAYRDENKAAPAKETTQPMPATGGAAAPAA